MELGLGVVRADIAGDRGPVHHVLADRVVDTLGVGPRLDHKRDAGRHCGAGSEVALDLGVIWL